MLLTEGLAEKLQQNIDVVNTAGLTAVVQFEITDAGNGYLSVDSGRCQFFDGDHVQPDVTIAMNADTLFDIIEGRLSGMQGFMFGRVSAVGDQRLAAKLDRFFKKQKYS